MKQINNKLNKIHRPALGGPPGRFAPRVWIFRHDGPMFRHDGLIFRHDEPIFRHENGHDMIKNRPYWAQNLPE